MIAQFNQNLENVKIYIYWLTDQRNNIEYKSFQNMVNNFKYCSSKIFTSIDIIINNVTKIFFKNSFIYIKIKSHIFNLLINFIIKRKLINLIHDCSI